MPDSGEAYGEFSEEDALAEATRRLAEAKEELRKIRESMTTESKHDRSV